MVASILVVVAGREAVGNAVGDGVLYRAVQRFGATGDELEEAGAKTGADVGHRWLTLLVVCGDPVDARDKGVRGAMSIPISDSHGHERDALGHAVGGTTDDRSDGGAMPVGVIGAA